MYIFIGRWSRAGFLLVTSLFASTSAFPQQSPPEAGKITGVVLDQSGSPVADAEVNIDGGQSALRVTQTNGAGEFTVAPVKFGTYKIFVLKPESGYPDTKFEIYAGSYHRILVSVNAANPNPVIKVVIGPRAGILKLAVVDKTTHQNIPNPTVILKRLDTGVWVSANRSPDSTVLVPASVPTQLTVKAEGYKAWSNYGQGAVETAPLLNIASGKETEMVVELEPDH